jgi:glutathione S-transferase
MPVVLHGPAYSTYTRTARLVLEEKGVPYELRDVDILTGAGQSPEHRARHPWGKVPALEHDGFALFETFAISRYIDEAFPGPRLQPEDARRRARMTQICNVVDSYAYGSMIGKVFWQEAVVPMQGGAPDQGLAAEGLAQAKQALAVLEGLMAEGDDALCGADAGISLADLHLAPVLEYFAMTGSGGGALPGFPRITAWGQRIAQRPSLVRTRPQLG